MKRRPMNRSTKPIGATTYAEALEKAQIRQNRLVANRQAQQANALSGPGIASQGLEAAKRRGTRMKRSKRDPQHEAWRKQVLERDGHRCRWIYPGTPARCSQTGDSLHAHHILTRKQRPDKRYDPTNGAALC